MADSFMANWVYTDTVKDHFINPRNIWNKDENWEPDAFGEVGSLACGDQMRVGIKVRDNIIYDIRWLTYGCASAIASTSMMSEMVKGMTLEEAIDSYLEKNNLPNPYKKSIATIVCECRGVTDQQIEELVKTDKATTLEQLQELTGFGTGCGKCKAKVAHLFEEMRHIYGKS